MMHVKRFIGLKPLNAGYVNQKEFFLEGFIDWCSTAISTQQRVATLKHIISKSFIAMQKSVVQWWILQKSG